MDGEMQAELGRARDRFHDLVSAIRPELHRYCARLTGSVIEGEDIVQDTLAKAFYAMSLSTELPPLRPWLFRIAHNTAIDFLRSHGRKYTEPREDVNELQLVVDDRPDPATVRAALARFLVLPVTQRSAVILKDVLGCSLEEAAVVMDTTVMAVKAALVRGRAGLREAAREDETRARQVAPAELERYASLFNARDWDGLRALLGEDCQLDLVSKSRRRGKAVAGYFARYAQEQVQVRPVELEGALALAAYERGAEAPSYFILLDFADGRVSHIRDFRYVPYIAEGASFSPVDPSTA